ncbi:4-hydroxy-tetrahydrodipicolinate synthase [Paenibacillus antri]|uniref:4-hydroxy-tetrahydrodipicolinate synthase n=1 Tax=Paenibacillus antri TaxID=2582848 RepID=A0A5R9GD56_9BACL|nr:4-hydroxy-tetrahydrodipicolinate synthase [Paenibacillus antri]TLS52256.1 4-hydroxy-tetrahydrodipicolinate synthase [Paenibacillus antri]
MDFGRLLTAMVTPFDGDLKIDWNQTAKLIDYLIDEQASTGLVIAGTTGESPTLTDEEKLELFRFAVRQANGRAKIIAGTGSNDTAHSIHLSQEAEKLGVDAIMLVSPYYSRTSQDGLLAHFRAVASSVSLPIMIYNIPSRTGVNIEAKTMLALADIPNIVAVKESSGDLDQMSAILAGAPDRFKLYSGDDSLTLPALSIGAYGIVSVTSHLVGKLMSEMIDAHVSGQPDRASKLHLRLSPMFKGMFFCPHRVPNPVPVKYAMKHRGIDCGGVRLPLIGVTPEEANYIDVLVASYEG